MVKHNTKIPNLFISYLLQWVVSQRATEKRAALIFGLRPKRQKHLSAKIVAFVIPWIAPGFTKQYNTSQNLGLCFCFGSQIGLYDLLVLLNLFGFPLCNLLAVIQNNNNF